MATNGALVQILELRNGYIAWTIYAQILARKEGSNSKVPVKHHSDESKISPDKDRK